MAAKTHPFIALSLDFLLIYGDGSAMSRQIGGLQTLIHQEYPPTFSFNCSGHRLNGLLECFAKFDSVFERRLHRS